MKERLQKIIAGAGVASRRAAEKLILEGRVQVDGEVVTELGTSADPDVQEVRVDGTRIDRARTSRARRTVALHKPRGFVTTRSDPGRRPTVMDLLPHSMRNLYPVGRLDMASTGLLILTDDGELAQRLTHPRFGVEKSYLVTVAGAPDRRVLERAVRGIVIDGERLSLEMVEPLSGRRGPAKGGPRAEKPGQRTRLRALLRRGKNREIRRLFGVLGFPVVELHRERIGALSLRGIPPGGFRLLTPAEIALLQRTNFLASGHGGRSLQPERRASEASPGSRAPGAGPRRTKERPRGAREPHGGKRRARTK